jgi:phospholipid-transporting ATPase
MESRKQTNMANNVSSGGQRDSGYDGEYQPPVEVKIKVHDGIINTNGLSNAITTTKYSLLTWLPKSLFEQFRRVANVYFVCISILMFIGTYAQYLFVSPLNPYSTLFTLVVVLMVTSVKEGLEDLARARSDKEENTRLVTVVTFTADGEAVETHQESRLVQAGDIVKLSGTMPVPVDMVLLLTSMYEDGNQCYIETSNIDGETNLKLKEAPSLLASMVMSGGGRPQLGLFAGKMEVEPPNKNIHNFVGALHLNEMSDPVALGVENLLLRSSTFTNTDWAYGVAVYTGQETKIQMNNKKALSKMSKLERYLNRAILLIFLAQLTLVCFSVGAIYFQNLEQRSRLPYVYAGTGSTSILPIWAEEFFVYFLLFNNFIPISLYVTIELVNLGQAFMVQADDAIYDAVLDCPCLVRASNLVQELGMVSNVFSDKTGTLTRNEMKFVSFVIGDKHYSVEDDGMVVAEELRQDKSSAPERAPPRLSVSRTDSRAMQELIEDKTKSSPLFQFLRCLSTCHTVIREKTGTYRAESPDELALLMGIGRFQFSLRDRGTSAMTVDVLGKAVMWDVLAVNTFTADRKRMSLVVKERETGDHYLMCKGADSAVLDLCVLTETQRKVAEKALTDLSCVGMRTLVVAQKRLTTAETAAWLLSYKAAATQLSKRADCLAEVGAAIETSMELLGITAIEDKLQDEVPEVIADLARAGIRLWMLTGDKEETAVNIGYSCNLLMNGMKLHYLTKISSPLLYSEQLRSIHNDVGARFVAGQGYQHPDGKVTEMALVIDGPSFTCFNFDDEEQRALMLEVGKSCRSVLACRLTPMQKQQLVSLVKTDSKPRVTCLSIGDGANDVSMIREADVGVGIFGKEGRQAANNADFAIGQFKFLRRLLLVHGRWNYIRQSKVFLYCMHKNMVITLTLFWFNFFTAMSGVSFYESWVYTGFNFILGLPIVFLGVQDRDVSARFALEYPEVYVTGRNNVYLTMVNICGWIFNAVVYSVVICLLFYYAADPSFLYYGLYGMGTTVFVGTLNALQWKVAYLFHQWDWIKLFLLILSIFGGLAYFTIISLTLYEYYGETTRLYDSALFWLYGFFAVPFFVIFIDVATYNFYMFFFPTEEMLFREVESHEVFNQDPLSRGMAASKQRQRVGKADDVIEQQS